MSLVCISSVIGQLDEFSFESIDGLPSSSRPSDILQDSRGFYWFSYEERGQGLFVYDGETLDHIPAKAYDSTALPDPNVCFLHELPNGHILMGTTARGLVEYDPESGKFEQIPIPTREGQIRRVNRVLEEHDDLLWLGCVGGLVKYVPSTRQSEVYKGTFDFEHERFSDPGNRIHALAQDPVDPDVIWLGNIMGLTSFHKSTGTFEQWVLPYIGIEEVSPCC